jgi:predicted dehydrogenase
MKAVGALPVAGAFGYSAMTVGRVKVGLVGLGAQGELLLDQMPPDCFDVQAVCDIYPPRRAAAIHRAERRFGAEPKAYEKVQDLLQHKGLEAVVIATPLWTHSLMTLSALSNGLHVFTEMMIASTVDDCLQMVKVANKEGKLLQVGHQRRYNPLYQNAVNQIASGMLGDIFHVRCVWHLNDSWRRAAPDVKKEASEFDPANWGYDDLDQWANWRLYKKYSAGLMGELGGHQIDAVNWLLGGSPKAVTGTGGIFKYRDGRDLEDHAFATLEYAGPGGGDVTCQVSAITTNGHEHSSEQFMGTKGTMIFTGETDGMYFKEGVDKMTEVTVANVDLVSIVKTASESRKRDQVAGPMSNSGYGGSADQLWPYEEELRHFAKCVRTGEGPLCNGEDALRSAVAVLRGNDAIRTKSRIELVAKDYGVA